MNLIIAATKNELDKMLHRKKSVVMLVLLALAPILMFLALLLFQNNLGVQAIRGSEFPLFVLSTLVGTLLPLFIAMTAIDMISGEFADRSIKLWLVRPVSRLKLYTSKVLALILYIAAALTALLIPSAILALIMRGWQDPFSSMLRTLSAYGSELLPLTLIGIMALCVAQFFKSGSGALTVSILIFFALKIVSGLYSPVSQLIPVNYTGWYSLWIGNSPWVSSIFYVFLFIVSYSIIFFVSGYFLFEKREF